jgi:uncharacterized protein YtpQ (UPF0354 family)
MNDLQKVNYEDVVKKYILYTFVNYHINQLSYADLSDILSKLFIRKEKAIDRLVKYVTNEVEVKNHPINKVLNNISMFPILFARYINKNDDGTWIEGFSEQKPF